MNLGGGEEGIHFLNENFPPPLQKKLQNTFLLLNPKSELLKKRLKKFPNFGMVKSFRIKIGEKNKTKYLKIRFC